MSHYHMITTLRHCHVKCNIQIAVNVAARRVLMQLCLDNASSTLSPFPPRMALYLDLINSLPGSDLRPTSQRPTRLVSRMGLYLELIKSICTFLERPGSDIGRCVSKYSKAVLCENNTQFVRFHTFIDVQEHDKRMHASYCH